LPKIRSRLNQQLLSGAKAELAQRLAENAIFGALAPCDFVATAGETLPWAL
jgi:hypothetical protein